MFGLIGPLLTTAHEAKVITHVLLPRRPKHARAVSRDQVLYGTLMLEAATVCQPGEDVWDIFDELCLKHGLKTKCRKYPDTYSI